MNEEKYIKGFNIGYILASHKPELLQTVTKTLPTTNDYVAGLVDGKEQLGQEKIQEQVKKQFTELENLRNNTNRKDMGLDR